MPNHLNSASRIHALIAKAASQPNNAKVLDVWCRVFELDDVKKSHLPALVSERLSWMLRELDSAAAQMAKTEYSEALYKPAVSKIGNAISPIILVNNWDNAKQYLTAETIQALAFWSEILPDEETQISPEELDEIEELIIELKKALDECSGPERLMVLVAHHIEIIEAAIAEYPIRGATAFRNAGRTGLGELIEVEETIKGQSENPITLKLGNAWSRINKITDTALKFDELGQLANRIQDFIGNL